MNNHNNSHNKMDSVVSFFIASMLLFVFLSLNDAALGQPSDINKLSKAEKCALGHLPSSACKKVPDQNQANTATIGSSQTGGNGESNGNESGNGERTESPTTASNSANSAIDQTQQSTQLCATGNIKALPHSTIICNNNANLGQENNGNISTSQTADRGLIKP